MATVTGLTAARMLAIEAASVVSGIISGNDLILTKHDGSTIDAGNVRGPQGVQGPPGSISVSPAGGALAGNYPDPTLADGAVTTLKVAAANRDGAAGTASMRTLGSGAQQAAPGNHSLLADTGWVAFPAPVAGDSPFGSATGTVLVARYRKVGRMVHVQIAKNSGSSSDQSGSSGNFGNILIMGVGSVPATARPDTNNVSGSGMFADSSASLILRPDGAIVWAGGQPRVYSSGSKMVADFVFLTSS